MSPTKQARGDNGKEPKPGSGPEHITVSDIIFASSHTYLTLFLEMAKSNIISADVDNYLTEFTFSISQHF